MKNLTGVYKGTLKERKVIAKGIKEESKAFGDEFIKEMRVPNSAKIIGRNGQEQQFQCSWRNRRFMVQYYKDGHWDRLSINRTDYIPEHDCWREGISWDDLMKVKSQLGFGDRDAIEIYPKDKDVVYVSNIRHLFLLPEGHVVDCIWRKNPMTELMAEMSKEKVREISRENLMAEYGLNDRLT